MQSAYVLIQFGQSASEETMTQLRAIEGVRHAHVVLGPTDCIAFVEAPDMDALIACVTAIRHLEGVEQTDTRLSVY